MKSILNLICAPRTALTVRWLRAVHVWSERAYHRALLRRELRRIGKEVAENAKLETETPKAETLIAAGGGRNRRSNGGTNG